MWLSYIYIMQNAWWCMLMHISAYYAIPLHNKQQGNLVSYVTALSHILTLTAQARHCSDSTSEAIIFNQQGRSVNYHNQANREPFFQQASSYRHYPLVCPFFFGWLLPSYHAYLLTLRINVIFNFVSTKCFLETSKFCVW